MSSSVTYICRICFQEDERQNLIRPCQCKGSMKYVHRLCLNEWRSSGLNPRNLTHCPVCKFRYETRYCGHSRKFKSMFFALFKLLLFYLIVFLVVSFVCGLFVHFVMWLWCRNDNNNNNHNFFETNKTTQAYHSPVGRWLYKCFIQGMFCFLALVGLYAVIKGVYLWITESQRPPRRIRRGVHDVNENIQNEDDHDENQHRDAHHTNANNRNNRHSTNRSANTNFCPDILIVPGGGGGGGSGGGGSSGTAAGGDCCKDTCKCLILLLVVIGILFLLYVVIVSIMKTIKEENRRVRLKLVEDYEVVDLEERFEMNHS